MYVDVFWFEFVCEVVGVCFECCFYWIYDVVVGDDFVGVVVVYCEYGVVVFY